MALTRLTEGPWRAIEEALLASLAERGSRTDFIEEWVIVPGSLLAEHIRRRLIPRLPRRAAGGLRLLTLEEAAGRILSTDGATTPRIDRLARDLTVRRELEGEVGELSGSLAEHLRFTPALYDACLRTLNDLREAGIDPSRVAGLAKGEKRGRRDRLRFLGGLYTRFTQQMERLGDADEEGRYRQAAGAVAVIPSGHLPGELAVYGFYDLTGGQRVLLDALLRVLPVTMYVPVYEETPAYAGTLLEHWRGMAGARTPVHGPKGAPSNEVPVQCVPLPDLWAHLADGRALPARTLTVTSSPGAGREVDTALRLIVAARRSQTVRWEVRTSATLPERYRSLLTEEARWAGLPEPDGESDREGAGARPVLEALISATGKVTPQGLARLLVLCERPGEEVEAPLLGESLLATCGSAADLPAWARTLEDAAAGLAARSEELAGRADTGEEELPPRLRAARLLARAGSVSAAARRTRRLQEAVRGLPNRASRWQAWVAALTNAARDLCGEEWWGSIGAPLAEELEEIEGLAALGTDLTPQEIAWAFRRGWEREPPGKDPSLDDIMSVRGLEPDLLLVLGMGESDWPGRPSQDPLLLDAERRSLAGAEEWLLPTSEHRLKETRLLFRLLAEAGRHVVFIYSRLDENGSVRRMSPLLHEELLRLGETPRDREEWERQARAGSRPLGQAEPLEEEPPLGDLDRDLRAVRTAIAGGAHEALHALWESACFATGWRAERARWGEEPGPWSGYLTDPEMREAALRMAGLGEAGTISASLLQEYAICPWRAFARRVLGLRAEDEEEDASGRLGPAEIGEVLHRVLARHVEERSQGDAWPQAEGEEKGDRARLRALLEHEVGGAYREGAGRAPALERADVHQALLRLEGWLRWEAGAHDDPVDGPPLAAGASAGWRPLRLEAPFEATIESGERRLRLTGIWDRVDAAADGRIRIVDYKTGGHAPPGEGELQGGTSLQMALYLLAASVVFAQEGPLAGGAYVHLDSRHPGREPARFPWSWAAIEAGRERLDRLIALLLEAGGQGAFPRLPHDAYLDAQTGRCPGCPTPTICRAWPIQESRRHTGHEVLRPLHAARRIETLEEPS